VKNIDNEHHAYRGGSWHDASANCRASFRNWNPPDNRYYNLGFRVVLSPPQDRVSLPSSVLPSNGFPPGSSSSSDG